MVDTSYQENIPKDIPKQEEFFSVLLQCEALVDIQIELFGRKVTSIQGFDSRLVKTGLVPGDTQTQWLPCGSLHQQGA